MRQEHDKDETIMRQEYDKMRQSLTLIPPP